MIINIKVKTNAKENCFEGIRDNIVIIRIKEKPVKGKANKAVIKFLAYKLGINTNQIKILKGSSSQYKTLEIETNLDSELLIKRLNS
jgi:uncharacterized protein (TIGR00251 family)